MNTIIYFSPTGNVKYIAHNLAKKLDNTDVLELEFTDPTTLKANDKLIIIYSIHAFNPPRTVRRFVKNIPEGLYKEVSLIAVGCADIWINDAASSGLKSQLEKKNYKITVDETLAMPLTFIMEFPEEVGKESVIKADKKLEVIAESILSSKTSDKVIKLKSKILHIVGKSESPAARLFGLELHANKTCTSCGICVKNCPEKNIKFNKNEIPKFGFNCLMCMRCIYQCPSNSISPRISKFIPIKNNYDITKYTSKGETNGK